VAGIKGDAAINQRGLVGHCADQAQQLFGPRHAYSVHADIELDVHAHRPPALCCGARKLLR
jgi:hypothetical protein